MTGQPEDITEAGGRVAPVEPVLYAAREQSAALGGSSLTTEGPGVARPKPKPPGGPLEWAADD